MPDALARARVAVTGGRGFIGRHVVAHLASRGASPVVLYDPAAPASPHDSIEEIAVDLEDPEAVTAALAGADRVVHLAARAGGIQFQGAGDPEVFTVNRRITDNVLAACARHGVGRVFLASSLVVYRPSAAPLREDDPKLAPGDRPSPYAWSKLSDEAAAGWYPGLPVLVGRFGNVYGPGGSFDPGRSTVVHALVERALTAEPQQPLTVWGDGSAVRSFIFVGDVARAAAFILTHGEPGTAYNVDGGVPVTVADLAALVRDAVDPGLQIAFDPARPSGPPYRVADVSRLRALGFSPEVDLAGGVRRTVEWRRRVRS